MAYSPEQRHNIALANRLSAGYGPRVRQALLEAMSVESNYRNLNYGDRDSKGVLQQRPSQGWGPAGNAATDIQQFLARARQRDRGFRGTPGQLAQAIQGSAFPGRYDQHAGEATRLLGGVTVGSGALGGGPQTRITSSGAPAASGRAAFAQSLIAANQQSSRGQTPDYSQLVSSLVALKQGRTATPAPAGAGGMAGASAPTRRRGDLKELFYDPLGGIRNGKRIGAIGGHSDHVHVATQTAAEMVQAIDVARRMGLTVSENPYVGAVHHVHVEHSNHYTTLGTVNGRKVGGATDVSGSPAKMARYFRWAARHL